MGYMGRDMTIRALGYVGEPQAYAGHGREQELRHKNWPDNTMTRTYGE